MKKIAVIGMGAIGKSIVLALAQNDCDVVAVTRRGQRGFADLCRFVEKAVENRKVQKSKSEILSRLSWSRFPDFLKVPYDADLVIEAIEEDQFKKQEMLKKLDVVFPPNVILSSTTSSLSITELSQFMVIPDRIIGLHFFNPAHIMKLVEIAPGEQTSSKTVEKVISFLNEIGKNPIVVPDQPGFLVNRILFAMINEAISVLGEGKISAEDIDRAMRLGTNHPMGPLHLADFIGLDACLAIFENLYKKTKSPQYKPHPLLRQKVKDNNLGRKTGKGFFNYA